MFLCIGENRSEVCAMGAGETIEKAISNWSTSRGIWGDIIEEFKWYDPAIIQGVQLDIELEGTPPTIKIL